ncbi:DUF1156 domain-containing protein [Spirulina sp. 06S082]|uniref:DUF1156 domain-containing protein n=1 Tax=Spirulina sp. 06S082 TaxID=3110248 RepID=UPI002B207762|nr:DUF1156 domain-containing protein [Spirulina sp. 06S082]MEA5467454.1 DUF1156 domain-containing protein [Spirulina sp. 06S082]
MDDRRLIEDYIPIKEISKEAAREKSIRKGHISTLHLWWARRPLVAARAAVFAALVAAPTNHQKRTAYTKQMIDLCQWKAGKDQIKKARLAILEAQRDRLNLPQDTPLGDVPPPKVLDMFAGGGAIPLEALRLGCETYAIDLNPVAHIIELCTLVYPQKYGSKLATEVETWGNWVIERVKSEIGDLYPSIQVGEALTQNSEQLELLEQKPQQLGLAFQETLTPVAYLWTRTVQCPNPSCGADVPLLRQTWLCKKSKKYVALRVIPNHETKRVEFKVVEATTAKDLGFNPALGSSRGSSTCHHCGTTIKSKPYIQDEGKAGRIGQQMMAIVCTTPGKKGKTYLSATDYQKYIPDDKAILGRLEKLCQETGLTTPDEPVKEWSGVFNAPLYGLNTFEKLFTPRQLLALMTFVKWVRLAHDELVQQDYEEDFAKAISTYLGILCNRLTDRGSTICRWDNLRDMSSNTFSRQALPMVWDFAENNPLGNASGNVNNALGWINSFLERESDNGCPAQVYRTSAMANPLDAELLDAVITDPPYFDSVPYADLSDFFYVWLKRSVGHLYPEHFTAKLTPKKQEAIMEPTRHGGDKKAASKAYEEMMHQAFKEAYRVLKPDGIMAVVYAHKTTSGWSTLIDSLRRAGFMITEAWPLDTEMRARLRGQNSAALASSIFLISRKRPNQAIGDYTTEVQPQLKEIVQKRVKDLMQEGVSGADLVIACIGAGLQAYTQFDRVELPNGDELDATTFLDDVQKEVLETILSEIMSFDKRGISSVDKPTQYYILARYEYGEAIVPFDEANTLARGVGIELDGPEGLTQGKNASIEKTKNTIQLQNYQQRGQDKSLGVPDISPSQTFNQKNTPNHIPTLIDVLHRLLWLLEYDPKEIDNFLLSANTDLEKLRLVAQALAGRALTPEITLEGEMAIAENGSKNRTPEQQAIDKLLASWKRTIEDPARIRN